ncbi:hypothetical protein AKO1_005757 [Acrasis kona]|uniref:Condensation domain-containing protein n=1 Tax=Acrasis kona TaxID=1008807 RepID=A0AAW2YK11_9EUKA
MKGRNLSPIETGSSDHDLGHCIIFSILTLEGPQFDDSQVHSAMYNLGRRHPILRATIIRNWKGVKSLSEVDEDTNPHFYSCNHVDEDIEPLDLVQSKLNERMRNEGPLLKIYLFANHPMQIVFAVSHAIMDGRSLFIFIGQFVKLLSGGTLTPQIIPHDNQLLHVDTYEQVDLLKVDNWKREAPTLSSTPTQFIPFDDCRKIRMMDVGHICLIKSMNGSKKLANKCRSKSVTVHAAVVAALTACNRWHDRLRSPTGTFVVSTPVGMWDKLSKVHPRAEEIEESIGVNFSLIDNEFSIRDGDGFWEVAKSYSTQLKKSMDQGEYIMPRKDIVNIGYSLGLDPFSSLKISQTILNLVGPTAAPKGTFLKEYHTAQERQKVTALVTNMGDCNRYLLDSGPYHVVSLPWFVSYTDPCPLLSVHTLHDELYLGFTFKSPLFSRETADMIADDCIRILEECIIKDEPYCFKGTIESED